MALLDPARARARLSSDELAVATVLLTQPDHDLLSTPDAREVLDELERSGALVDGQLVGYVAELVGVVAAPKLRIIVETFRAERLVVHQLWSTEHHGVVGVSEADGVLELAPVEPALLYWEIARLVGLGARPPVVVERSFSMPNSALEAVFGQLAGGDAAQADATLERETTLGAGERQAFLVLLLDRRISWRASSVWTSERGRETRTMTVIDGGDAGLWLSRVDGELGENPTIVLEPSRPSAAWRGLIELLPDSAAILASTTPVG